MQTSSTLLWRVRDPTDQEAWTRFYGFYAPLVVGFSRQRGCDPHMANDVLQETMVCLMKQISCFAYDPGRGMFRSFLLKIVHARIIDAFRRARRLTLMDGPTAARVADLPSERDPDALEKQWDGAWYQQLMGEALGRVRGKIDARTFRSFEMYVLEERPVGEVATALGLTPNAVYQQKNRVMRLLREHVAVLRREIGE